MQTQENEIKQASCEAQQDNAITDKDVNTEADTQNVETAPEGEEKEAETLDPLSVLQAENAALKAHLEKVESAAKSDLQKMVRAIAEADNQRKRAEADVERERKYGIEKFAKALLPVVDSLELAITHGKPEDENCKVMLDGVQNTLALFLKEMKNFGVEVIDPQGQAFDPNVHQAISMIPSEAVASNHVLQVMQKGYLLNGRVVRAATVIVSAGPGPKKEESKEEPVESKKINIEIQS